MLAELRSRLGRELDRLSAELMDRLVADGGWDGEDGRAGPAGEEQRALQGRIRLLGQLVAGLDSAGRGAIWPDRAGYGSLVRVRDPATGAERTHLLVAGDSVGLEEGQVPLDSPVGCALVGQRPGARVWAATSGGVRRLEIVSLVTLPGMLGMAAASPLEAAAGPGAPAPSERSAPVETPRGAAQAVPTGAASSPARGPR